MRLPNKYGSVSKLSGNRRRPWIVRLTTGWDALGKREVRILGYYAKRTEALDALAEYNKNPYDPAARSITFAEIFKKWLEEKYPNGAKPNTQYMAAYNYCAPLYELPFIEIKTAQFQKIINDCPKGEGTKKAIKIICNQMAKYALANDLANKNYVELTRLPAQSDSDMHKPFTIAELKTLWQHADDERVQAVLILCYTGMRPSELVEIERDNVNLTERWMRGGKKTAAGKNRIIPIAEKIFPFVEKIYNATSGKYLFPYKDKNLPYAMFRLRYWAPAMNMLGWAHLPHDGRHTCATLLDNADVNVTIRKLILGHSRNDVTERVYTHKVIAQLVEAINLI